MTRRVSKIVVCRRSLAVGDRQLIATNTSALNRARESLCENSSTEPRASASEYTTRPAGTGASVPRRPLSPLLSTQAQSPRGQSEPVPRFRTVDSSICPRVFTQTREQADSAFFRQAPRLLNG